MSIIYNFGVSICLVIIQTTIIPVFFNAERVYDLIVTFVIYLGIFCSVRESISVIFWVGFIMDYISGTPFGMYISTYFWILVFIRWITNYIQITNWVLFSIVIAVGILFENFICYVSLEILGVGVKFSKEAVTFVCYQIIGAIFTGPFLLLFYRYLYSEYSKWITEFVAKRSRSSI